MVSMLDDEDDDFIDMETDDDEDDEDEFIGERFQHDRRENDQRLKSRFEQIFRKYERDFTGIGDEIDLETFEIVVDNGHLMSMQREAVFGVKTATTFIDSFAHDLDELAGETPDSQLEDDDDYDEHEHSLQRLGSQIEGLEDATSEPNHSEYSSSGFLTDDDDGDQPIFRDDPEYDQPSVEGSVYEDGPVDLPDHLKILQALPDVLRGSRNAGGQQMTDLKEELVLDDEVNQVMHTITGEVAKFLAKSRDLREQQQDAGVVLDPAWSFPELPPNKRRRLGSPLPNRPNLSSSAALFTKSSGTLPGEFEQEEYEEEEDLDQGLSGDDEDREDSDEEGDDTADSTLEEDMLEDDVDAQAKFMSVVQTHETPHERDHTRVAMSGQLQPAAAMCASMLNAANIGRRILPKIAGVKYHLYQPVLPPPHTFINWIPHDMHTTHYLDTNYKLSWQTGNDEGKEEEEPRVTHHLGPDLYQKIVDLQAKYVKEVAEKRAEFKFTKQEDDLLYDLKVNCDASWKETCAYFPERTTKQLQNRLGYITRERDPALLPRRRTAEEIAAALAAEEAERVRKEEDQRKRMAANAERMRERRARLRLIPSGPYIFTEKDDRVIERLRNHKGLTFPAMTLQFPGASAQEIGARYLNHILPKIEARKAAFEAEAALKRQQALERRQEVTGQEDQQYVNDAHADDQQYAGLKTSLEDQQHAGLKTSLEDQQHVELNTSLDDSQHAEMNLYLQDTQHADEPAYFEDQQAASSQTRGEGQNAEHTQAERQYHITSTRARQTTIPNSTASQQEWSSLLAETPQHPRVSPASSKHDSFLSDSMRAMQKTAQERNINGHTAVPKQGIIIDTTSASLRSPSPQPDYECPPPDLPYLENTPPIDLSDEEPVAEETPEPEEELDRIQQLQRVKDSLKIDHFAIQRPTIRPTLTAEDSDGRSDDSDDRDFELPPDEARPSDDEAVLKEPVLITEARRLLDRREEAAGQVKRPYFPPFQHEDEEKGWTYSGYERSTETPNELQELTSYQQATTVQSIETPVRHVSTGKKRKYMAAWTPKGYNSSWADFPDEDYDPEAERHQPELPKRSTSTTGRPRGRPKGSKSRLSTSMSVDPDADYNCKDPVRPRGRPKGSKSRLSVSRSADSGSDLLDIEIDDEDASDVSVASSASFKPDRGRKKMSVARSRQSSTSSSQDELIAQSVERRSIMQSKPVVKLKPVLTAELSEDELA